MTSILTSILTFVFIHFGGPIIFIYETVTNFQSSLIENFQQIKATSPQIVEFLQAFCALAGSYLRFYYLNFILRLMLYWFPNLNPFTMPYYIVLVLTNPPLDFIGKRLPRLFGMDFSFLVVTTIITLLIQFLDKVKF